MSEAKLPTGWQATSSDIPTGPSPPVRRVATVVASTAAAIYLSISISIYLSIYLYQDEGYVVRWSASPFSSLLRHGCDGRRFGGLHHPLHARLQVPLAHGERASARQRL